MSLRTTSLVGLSVSAGVFIYAGNITPAGTYFNLKLAMLLSLVAEINEV